jgi:acyl-CoA thioesterase FadM
MYPYLRYLKAALAARSAPPLGILDAHVSRHLILPWDLDPWNELNNGRTLTLFDLGRIPMAMRMGFDRVAKAQGWGLTVAGTNVRYRKRVTLFQRLTMVSRVTGWDKRFVYIEQSLWRGEECTSHMLLRSAFTSRAGIVPPAAFLRATGQPEESPPLPDWIADWIAADATRPWPPRR